MAELTNDQRAAVRQWVEGGASLSDVQQRLKETFGLTLTYMDVRLLTLDLGAQVKDKPEPKKAPAPAADATAEADAAEEWDEDAEASEASAPGAAEAPAKPAGKVSVTLDRLMRPGALVSGDVTFSDGKKAHWLLDQMGRLGLEGVPKDYRPSPEDVRDFQTQLQKLLASKGY